MISAAIAVPLIAIVLFTRGLSAGEFNPILNIGDPAPTWAELPAVDGQSYALDSFPDSKLVVVAFTCNSCPYAVDSEDRLIALSKQYDPRDVAIVAINVNNVEEDRMPAMKQRALEKGFTFPYLYDETQKIARAYGAAYTPEFFLLNQKRAIAYMGAMDDSPDGKTIKQHYLKNAIERALINEPVIVKETVPIGCQIRYERQRRKPTR